jgi:hypothetical protein
MAGLAQPPCSSQNKTLKTDKVRRIDFNGDLTDTYLYLSLQGHLLLPFAAGGMCAEVMKEPNFPEI